jgi:hypothetical protein
VYFVADRYEWVVDSLDIAGYEVATRKGQSRWNEVERLDPVAGLVDIRGTLKMAGFSAGHPKLPVHITEIWERGRRPEVMQEQGHSLVGFSYHQQAGSRRLRFCLNDHHAGMTFHAHRPGEQTARPCAALDLDEALATFGQFIFDELEAGRLTL